MPGIPEKNNQQLVLVPEEPQQPPADESEQQQQQRGVPQQPRQPQNLQGLLRFAMEAGASASSTPNQQPQQQQQQERSVEELDEERKAFLREALQAMSVDVTAVIREQIKVLSSDDMSNSETVEAKLAAFDTILDYIDNIDVANDFHKIGGFTIFEPCLNCKQDRVREKGAELLAELAQNNPYIQNVICESTSLMRKLIELLEKDVCADVRVKALYAVSCITRDNKLGYETFKLNKGLDHLKSTLVHENDKLRTKSAFLLSALFRMDDQLFGDLLKRGYLSVIVEALAAGERRPSHEHLLDLLSQILEHDARARVELSKCTYSLQETINRHLEGVRGREEFREEQQYCEKILRLVFTQVA